MVDVNVLDKKNMAEFYESVRGINNLMPFLSHEAIAGCLIAARINNDEKITEGVYSLMLELINRALSN